jgi:hypothetical protein
MAHFAQIKDGFVINVLFVSNEDILDENENESEEIGKQFLENLLEGQWVQTSINRNFRYNYATIGGTFDPNAGEDGAFIGQRPHPSWILDENYVWVAPIPRPDDKNIYAWDEESQEWIKRED